MLTGTLNRLRARFCLLALMAVVTTLAHAAKPVEIPDFSGRSQAPQQKGEQTAVFAAGCFWGVEAVFEHVKGVATVVSGYAGGTAATAKYDLVSRGRTEHAEAVKITFDPARISYAQLLKILFSVAHDPTQLNRQGPDVGPHYRSAIFYANEEQKQIAHGYIEQLGKARVFPRPIVTQVVPLQQFYPAEDYHQDFVARNPRYPYVVVHDLPKLAQLRKQFPTLYK